MDTAESLQVGPGNAVVFSRRAPGKTTSNEDAALVAAIDLDHCVLAVADGAGGMQGGEQASRTAVSSLERTLSGSPSDERGVRAAILDGLEDADRKIRTLGIGAATTLAAVEIRKRKIRSYHVGDSAVLVVGQRGKFKFHTVAHSPVGYATAAGALTADEAMAHESRHLVYNMVGSGDMHMEIGPTLDLAPRDTVLVATDGLFDNVYIEEIIEIVRKGPLPAVGNTLAETCLERMESQDPETPFHADDVTFFIYRPAVAGRHHTTQR